MKRLISQRKLFGLFIKTHGLILLEPALLVKVGSEKERYTFITKDLLQHILCSVNSPRAPQHCGSKGSFLFKNIEVFPNSWICNSFDVYAHCTIFLCFVANYPTDLILERCSNFLSHCASCDLVIGTLAWPHFWNTMSTANRLYFLSRHLLRQIKTFFGKSTFNLLFYIVLDKCAHAI